MAAVVGRVPRNGQELLAAVSVNQKAPHEMQQYLDQRLREDAAFFSACFNSRKTIKDRLRLWDLADDGAEDGAFPKSNNASYFQGGEEPAGFSRASVKYRLLEKIDASNALIDAETYKPHAVHVQHTKKVVLDHNRDLFVDVQQDLALYVFLWPDIQRQQNDAFFLEHLSKFKDFCDANLRQTMYELSSIKNLPLAHRVKTKPEYFQVR